MILGRGPGRARPGVRPRSIPELLPQGALVFARRGDRAASIMDAVLEDAGGAAGRRLTPVRLSARGGVMLAFCDRALVRVAVGPGRASMETQRRTLDALLAADPPEAVARLVPWTVATGRSGLADWNVEPLMPGVPAGRVDDSLMTECVEFLVGLHLLGGGAPLSMAAAAEVVAMCAPGRRRPSRAIAARLDSELADVPRGFGHGDFFAENLLVGGGRLAGVVDWDGAGPGRLPMLDLLHLLITSRWEATTWAGARRSRVAAALGPRGRRRALPRLLPPCRDRRRAGAARAAGDRLLARPGRGVS